MLLVDFCRTKAKENGLIDEIKGIQKWMSADIPHQILRENVNNILSENAQAVENIAVGSTEIKLTGFFSDAKIREKIVVSVGDFGVLFRSENEQIAFTNLIKNDNPTLCYAYISRNWRRVETRDLSKAMFGTRVKFNHAVACSLTQQGLPFYGMRPQKI